MRRIISIIVICVVLSGCANWAEIQLPNEYGDMKTVCRVKQSGEGMIEFDPTSKKVTVDSRRQNWWQQNIVPMFSGMLDKASRAR